MLSHPGKVAVIRIAREAEPVLKKPLKSYDRPYFYNYNKIQKFINKSERPLIILGSGALESKEEIREITEKYQIPVATTYPAKGLVDENEKHSLGLIGNRGLERSKYAFENSDCIIALGTRLSERTIKNTDEVKDKLIHVNIDNNCLKGKFRVHGSVREFINHINFNNSSDWLSDILKIKDSKKEWFRCKCFEYKTGNQRSCQHEQRRRSR